MKQTLSDELLEACEMQPFAEFANDMILKTVKVLSTQRGWMPNCISLNFRSLVLGFDPQKCSADSQSCIRYSRHTQEEHFAIILVVGHKSWAPIELLVVLQVEEVKVSSTSGPRV